MRQILFWAGLTLTLGLAPLHAGAPVTWEQALAEARSSNRELLQAQESLRQAQLNELGAKAQFLPRVGVSASGSQSGDYEPQGGALTGGNGSVGLGLSGSLNLFNGFAHVAALSQAKARRVQAEASLQEAQASLVHDLTRAFYQSVYVQQQVSLADAIAARAKDNADMVELRYEAGAENKGSLLQASALAGQYKFEAARARRQARLAALSLGQLLGRPVDPELQAQGSLSKPEALAEPDFEALTRTVPALAKAQAVADAAQGAKLGAWSPFLPTLNASAGLNRSGPEWAPQNGSWNAGLSLNLNLFNGFSDTLSLRTAESGRTVATLALEEARLQARLDLENAWSALQDAQAQVTLSAASLAATQARAEIGQAQYAQGLMSFENWDQIETQLSNSLKSELNSQLGAVTAMAAWIRATGKGPGL